MPKAHVGLGLPTPQVCDIEFAFGNLPQIMFDAKAKGYKISLLYKSGVRTDSNRNYILNEFLQIEDLTHILWLDVDQIYPKNIIDKLVKADKDIIGSVYFKRDHPHAPVVYVKNNNEVNPYTPVDLSLNEKKPLEVDGIGFGGMLVKREVYESLGDDKWMTYGKNFHIPTATTYKESHDLNFCKTCQKNGYKIWVHNDCYAHHIAKFAIGLDEYRAATYQDEPLKPSKIAVLMPCIDRTQGTHTIKKLADSAGLEADYFLLMDDERVGYVRKINEFVNNREYDFYVYTCQDVKTEENWLLEAYKQLEKTKKGVLAFHDNKWNGKLAAFGMVRASYMRPFFEDCYKMHYADTELSVKAKLDNQLTYTPKAIMYEVDKKGNQTTNPDRPVNKKDRETFKKRQKEIYKVKMFG
jgi:hypothetical protein